MQALQIRSWLRDFARGEPIIRGGLVEVTIGRMMAGIQGARR